MTVRKYKKGDRLVYPHHGACTVEKIEKMTAFDVKQDYLKLKVAYTDLVLMVPVANAESVGLLMTRYARAKAFLHCSSTAAMLNDIIVIEMSADIQYLAVCMNNGVRRNHPTIVAVRLHFW